MKNSKNSIIIKGANENNLKNIDLVLPKNKLIIFTGLSGSGKSSLAFNTIYEEGRRRYVDSLSSYARQFLGNSKKPNVASIEGLNPAISIEQKTTHNNPRSTVGTVTEIFDYLRLLYARIGRPFCPKHKTEITAQKSKDIIDDIFAQEIDSKLLILSPMISQKRGTHTVLLDQLRRDGFLRLKINDKIYSLDNDIKLDRSKKHNISIVVDRLVLKEDNRQRINEAVEIALEYSNGLVDVENMILEEVKSYSKNHSCPYGDFDMPLIETKLFSFNSPYGMCNQCKGLGVILKADFRLVFPDMNSTINLGGIEYFKNTVNTENLEWQEFNVLINHYDIDKNKQFSTMTKKEIRILSFGSEKEIQYSLVSKNGNQFPRFDYIDGVLKKVEKRYTETLSEQIRTYYKKYMGDVACNSCGGKRLNKYALAVQVDGININQWTKLSINDSLEKTLSVNLNDYEKEVSHLIITELVHRLSFLNDVGLDYLDLARSAYTLSGGEAQRIRLATQMGSNLTGVLYVLDEPSIGLHQKDNAKLINTLKHMVEIGNTLIVVEHDEETIKNADHIVDIGPLAGNEGGYVIAQGTLEEVKKVKESWTAKFLREEETIAIPKSRRSGNGAILHINQATQNNLKKIDAKIPLGKFIAVTGVSGSGKSTLINEVLINGIEKFFNRKTIKQQGYKNIEGLFNIDKLVKVSQSPIGRTPRSNAATYTSVFDDIRDVFANVELARARGYKKGRFSFNVPGGRCDKCHGDGYLKIGMHFLPDVYVECDHCLGKRYNTETLDVKYKMKTIFDVLNMRVNKAIEFFASRVKIKEKLQTLMDVGIGYITLGQPATTLSGGEAQRIKLATYLLKKPTGKTLFVLDEPTTGLHSYDVRKLLKVLNRIVDNGDTVLVIEHNLDVIKTVDYIIDLGPGGGVNGGKIIASGTPEQVAKKHADSYTGKYLKEILGVKKS